MSNCVIEAINLNKNFSENSNIVEAVKNVSFTLGKSEIMIIFGRSGSGKSTLLYLLAGLETCSSGNIKFNTFNFEDLTLDELASIRRSNIGFVYQFHHLIPEFSAIDNASFPLLLNGDTKEEAYVKAEDILNKFGLGKRKNHKPNQLSGGERQRVAIARSIINKPSSILMDEPTGNLDNKNVDNFMNLVLDLSQDLNISLIIATHDNNVSSRLDRLLNLE